MRIASAVRLAKRVLPWDVYLDMKRHCERLSPRPFFFLLPYHMFRRYQYPSLLSISLTTRCNLRCFICRREHLRGEDLQFDNLYKLEKAIRHSGSINLTGLGETLVYPKFEDVIKYIYSLNDSPQLIRIITNGTRLSRRTAELLNGHLRSLTISLNAATADTYNRDMRPGNFETTLSAIQSFMSGLSQKHRRKVKLHFVAHTKNFREVPEFILLAEKLGIATVSVGQYLVSIATHRRYSLLNVKQEYNGIIQRAQAMARERKIVLDARRFLSERNRPARECLSPFNECYIDVKGNVTPCCHSGGHSMGNVYETSFEKVWFGAPYRRLRKERYLAGCRDCVLFIPLDKYGAHFTSCYKTTREFKEGEQEYRDASHI